ncbi:MAG: hypothetical protein ACYC8T_15800 [Myxococcaceae bacterium]
MRPGMATVTPSAKCAITSVPPPTRKPRSSSTTRAQASHQPGNRRSHSGQWKLPQREQAETERPGWVAHPSSGFGGADMRRL